jgi:hypothetical protein
MEGSQAKRAADMRRKPSTASWLDTLVLAVLVGSIYIGHLSSQYNFDGTVFAFRVEKALGTGEFWELFHPRHLLYEPLGYLFYKLAYISGSGLRSIIWLEIMDTIFGVAGLCLFHRLSLRLGMDRIIGAGITLCLAFSFGFWFFAVEPEVYVPGVFFLILGFFSICMFMEKGLRGFIPALVLGVLAAVTMGNHIVNGLFLIPLCFGAFRYLCDREEGQRALRVSGFFPVFVLIAVCFILLALIYYEAGVHSALAREIGARNWFLGLADPETPFGYRKSYWVFHPHAASHWLYGILKLFFAEGSHRLSQNPSLVYPLGLAIFIMVFLLFLYLLSLRSIPIHDRPFHVLIWLWLVPYALFTVVWEPRNFELKVFLLVPFYLLLGFALKEFTGRLRILRLVPAILALLLFLVNYYGAILPGAEEKNNLDLERAYFIRENTGPEALIYLAGVSKGYNIGKIYIPYFSGRQTKVMDWHMKEFLSDEGVLNLRVRPGAYILEELIRAGPALKELAGHHRVSPEAIRRSFLGFNPVLVARHDKDFALYRLSFP